MRTKKNLALWTQLYLDEHPDATAEELVHAGYKLAIEDKKKETKKQGSTELQVSFACGPSFEEFWNTYDKKRERQKCESLWNNLSQSDKVAIMEHLPRYVASTPEIKYRKDPQRYLRNRCWEDQIITEDNGKIKQQEQDFFTERANTFARLVNNRKPNP